LSKLIADLEPWTQAKCERVLAAAATFVGRPVRLTWTERTMEEQQQLWEVGRKLENGIWIVVGKTVTRARPGQSPHNYRMAFDICFQGADPYLEGLPEGNALWERYGQLVESVGLAWGGRWHVGADRPHAERPDWRTAHA